VFIMKVTILSDWHGNFNLFPIPHSDVICVCGDMISRTYDIAIYPGWLESLPAKVVLVIPGNHDVLFNETWAPENSEKVFNPVKQPITFKGVTFGGFAWNYTDSQNLAEVWQFMTTDVNLIKDRLSDLQKCDILLSHSPPAGCNMPMYNGEDIGVPGLLEWAIYNGCKYIVCGHIHEQSGSIHNVKNVSVLNTACNMITFEIEPKTLELLGDYKVAAVESL